ncbi:MAG: hypothetical protein ABSB24_12820 [Gaiellaceae bacterium]|jgi:hypothetical protein
MSAASMSLVDQARAIEHPLPVLGVSGLWGLELEGRSFQASQAQLDEIRAGFAREMRRGLDRVNARIAGGVEGHRDMIRIHEDQFMVSRISDVLGGVTLPDISIWDGAYQALWRGQADLRAAHLSDAARDLEQAESSSQRAYAQFTAYREGTISGAGRAVTGLEVTRDVSFATAGIIATVATGGAAGAVIGAGITATGTAAQQAMEVHLDMRREVDWAGIGFDAVIGLITSKLGGALGGKVAGKLLGDPAVAGLGRKAVSTLVNDLISGKASSILHTTARAVFDHFQGSPQAMSMDQFLDTLARQLVDPKSTFMDILTGEVARRAHARSSAAPEHETAPPEHEAAPPKHESAPPEHQEAGKPGGGGAPPPAPEPAEIVGEPVRVPKPAGKITATPTEHLENEQARSIAKSGGKILATEHQEAEQQRARTFREQGGKLRNPAEQRVSTKGKVLPELAPKAPKKAPAPVPEAESSMLVDPQGVPVVSGARAKLEAPLGLKGPLPAGETVRGQVVEPLVIEKRYPGAKGLPPSFEGFDAVQGAEPTRTFVAGERGPARPGLRYEGGTAISIKSIELNGASYETSKGTYSSLKHYVDAAADYPRGSPSLSGPASGGRVQVTLLNPTERVLHLELTRRPTSEQMDGFALLKNYATERGIKLVLATER